MKVLAVIFLILLQPLVAGAQFNGNEFINTDLFLELSPAFPQPGRDVTITLNDYGSNLYGAELEWFQNDIAIPNTKNERSITVTAPPVGQKTTISLNLITQVGIARTLRETIAPVYADIIVEPQTHVPGFYKGRALPSPGSTVNLTAILSDGEILSTDLVYTWKVNETVLEAGPLRGRNSISFVATQDKELDIYLEVAKPTGAVIARRYIYIASVLPELYFYELNTLYGVETKSIQGTFNMIADSNTFVAEPYYLDSNVFNNPDIMEWKINQDVVTPAGNNPYELTLDKTGEPGRSKINLHVRSTTELLQGAWGDFNIDL